MGVDIVEAAGGLIVGQREARGARFWPKTPNRAIVARFRARRVKRQCRVVPGGNRCGWISRRRQVGYAFANARPGGGFWAQKPETEHSWLGFGCAA
jgi:hypothetical protein